MAIGDRFGRLVVASYGTGRMTGKKNPRLRKTVVVKCDCGKSKEVVECALVSGQTTSCGCFRREQKQIANRKNAKTVCHDWSHPLASVWWSMHVRCSNPNNKRWHRYGGRGIVVCERWNTFSNFLEDMPERPAGMTLDRRDNDGNYEPGNCRWATKKTQGNNSSKTRLFKYRGEQLSITQFAEKYGMKAATLWARLKRGMTIKDALSLPLRKSTKTT